MQRFSADNTSRDEYLGQDFDIPPTVIFRKVEKKIIFQFFFFYPPTLNIICSDTVKNDCPVQIFRKMMKYIKI